MAEPPGQGLCLAAVVGSSPSEPRLMSQRFPQVWTKWDSCVHIAYIPLEAGAYRSQVPSSVRTGGRRKPDKGASGLAPPTVSPPPPAPVRFGAPCCWGCRIAYTSLSSVGRGVAPRIHSPSIPWRLTFGSRKPLLSGFPLGFAVQQGCGGGAGGGSKGESGGAGVRQSPLLPLLRPCPRGRGSRQAPRSPFSGFREPHLPALPLGLEAGRAPTGPRVLLQLLLPIALSIDAN